MLSMDIGVRVRFTYSYSSFSNARSCFTCYNSNLFIRLLQSAYLQLISRVFLVLQRVRLVMFSHCILGVRCQVRKKGLQVILQLFCQKPDTNHCRAHYISRVFCTTGKHGKVQCAARRDDLVIEGEKSHVHIWHNLGIQVQDTHLDEDETDVTNRKKLTMFCV